MGWTVSYNDGHEDGYDGLPNTAQKSLKPHEYNAGYKAGQKAKARDQKRKEKNAKPIKWT